MPVVYPGTGRGHDSLMAQDPNPVEIKVTSSADLEAVDKTTETLKDTTEATKELEAAEAKRAENEKAHADWLADHQRRLEQYAAKAKEIAQAEADLAAVKMPDHMMGPPRDEAAEELEALQRENAALEVRKQLEQDIADAVERIEQAGEGAARKTEDVNEQGKILDRMLLGQGLGQASELFHKMEANLGDFAKQLEHVNPELAETFETASKGAGALSNILGGAAVGAAAGGPIGAGIGAIVTGLLEMGKTWLETAAMAAQAEQTMRDSARATQDAIRERNAELAGDAAKAWVQSLGDEEKLIARINIQLEKNIELARAKRRADLEIEDSKAALELAKIDADPSLSEEEKIRRRAGVQEGIERRKAQGKLDDLAAQDAEAQKAAQDANAQVRRKQADIATAEKREAEQEAIIEANRGKGDEDAAANAKKEAAAIADQLKKLRDELAELSEQAFKARENAERVGGTTREQARGIIGSFENDRQRRAITAGSNADRARDHAAEQEQREAERRRQQDQRDAERHEAETSRTGRAGESIADQAARLLGGKLPKAADAVEQLGNQIAANPTLQGLDKLGSALDKLAGTLAASDPATARKLRELNDKVERLEQQMKRNGDGR